jgi:hypothetical protein
MPFFIYPVLVLRNVRTKWKILLAAVRLVTLVEIGREAGWSRTLWE